MPKVETPPGKSAPRNPARAASGVGPAVSIPFASIIRCVPQELWGKLAPAGAGAAEYVLSRNQILEQLPQGAVKVSFAELRRHGPAGLFANNSSQDNRLIDLPLPDILAQLHPDAFARRPNQSLIRVSEDVPDLFGAKGERLAPLRVLDKHEAAASAAATRQNTPAARNNVPAEQKSAQQPTPAKAAPAPRPFASAPAPVASIKPVVPLPTPTSVAAKPTATPQVLPKAPSVSAAPSTAKPLPIVAAAKPASPSVAPQSKADVFVIPVAAVAEAWPEEVRKELASMKLPGAYLALPANEICDGLKRRMVQFPWGKLREWMQPQPAACGASPFDSVVLELPLNIITPLFLDHIRSNPANPQVADSETITDFFRRADRVAAARPAAMAPKPASRPVAPAAPSSAPSETVEGTVELPIAQISSLWPDAVKHDVAQFNLGNSVVCIPAEYVDAGLKTGKVEFTWRQVCAWLKPASPSAQLSINGELRVLFPLNLIAPLFMQRNSGAQNRRKTRVDQEIPDIFSAGGLMPQPAEQAPVPAAPAAVAAPAPTPVAKPSATPALAKAPARSLSELFNEPDKRSWTPNDIVHRAAQLPGVAGALIALQDGLLVAACMPPDMRTETIAAFVPQIFGRMSQYTRELQLGDAKGVSFTVDSGTLQVFNAGIIYFAAFGKTGVTLPLSELQLIATELGRHTK